MTRHRDSTKTLKVKVDPELFERLKQESENLEEDVSTYLRWCIQTGPYLKALIFPYVRRPRRGSTYEPIQWRSRYCNM